MTNPTRIEINCSTGVESVIELTDAEAAELAQLQEDVAAKLANEEAQKEADAIAKAALLKKLGITADEAKLLLS